MNMPFRKIAQEEINISKALTEGLNLKPSASSAAGGEYRPQTHSTLPCLGRMLCGACEAS